MEPRELYDLLFKDKVYDDSYGQFKEDYGSPQGQKELHELMSADKLYTDDFAQFQQDYFQVKKKPASKSSVDLSVAWPPNAAKLSSTPRNAPIAREDSEIPPYLEAGQPKSAFQKNADSVYQLVVTNQAQDSPVDQFEVLPEQMEQNPANVVDAADALFQTANRGFYKTAIGGTLRGSGEAITKFHNWLFDDNADVSQSWLYQAGTEIQERFPELTARKDLTEGTLGQVGDAGGQLLFMVATAPSSIAAKTPGAAGMLKTAASQVFSRSTVMASMQMLDNEATNIRKEKAFAEGTDKNTYVQLGIEAGEDPKLTEQKYDKLTTTDADDMISDMLPMILAAGGTEVLPLAGFFRRLNKVSNGTFGKVFMEKAKDVAIGTFEGATQEALQEWMLNASAKEVYDFTREATDNLEQSAKVGGIVQFIFEATAAAIGIKNRGLSGPDKELLDKAQDELKTKEETLAKNLENAVVEETPISSLKTEVDARLESGEITPEEAGELIAEVEAKKQALSKIPEEHKTTPEVVDATVEKNKVDSETETLKESIKDKDPAFTADEQAKIKENELKSAELSVKVSEAAGLKPDPKAVKLLEAQKEAGVGNTDSRSKEPEKPLTIKELKKQADEKLEEYASRPETDLANTPEQDAVKKILKEGSPAQVGRAWSVEPNVAQGEIFTKESAIEDAVVNSTFDARALEGIPDISNKYLPKKGQKANVVDLRELAEELSDQTGMNITEVDVADYIRSNPDKKKPKKIVGNPNKTALARRFKELTGIAPNPDYVERLSERAGFLQEKQAAEQEFPEAAETRPVQQASEKMKKSLLNRVVNDVLLPLETREKAMKGELDYSVLKDEYVSATADQEIVESMKTMDFGDAMRASEKTAKDLLREAVDTDDTNARETNGAIASAILQKAAYHFGANGMVAEQFRILEWLDSYSRGAGRGISSLRASAASEGVAGRTALRVFEAQVRELSKKGKNATLDQMLKGLKEEIAKARTKETFSAAKAAAGKTIKTEGSKKAETLKAERSDILARIKARTMDTSLGAVYDPEQQAEKAAELLDDVAMLVRNLVESGITKVQEIYDNIVKNMRSIGFSDEDSERIARDVVLRTNKNPIGVLPVGEEVKLLDKQALIDKVVDKHYEKQDGRALWAELVDAGLSEKEAKAYQKKLEDALTDKESAAVLRAIRNFKQKVQEEKIEGIRIHEKMWNDSVDKLVAAHVSGALNDQGLASAVSGYFGFPSITAQDVADIQFISDKIINGLLSNAVVNATGQTIGYQPVGQPAPAGTTLQPVNQKSPELMARAQKEMKVKLLQLERRNKGLMHILAPELHAAMHMGALANTGTWYNVISGTLWNLGPAMFGLSVNNPIAAVRAIQEISKSRANNWKMGWGVFRDAFMTNFSHLNTRDIMFDGQYTSHASLLEAAMLQGMKKRAEKFANASGTDKIKELPQLVAGMLIQAYRIASMPMMIDGLLTHPVAEYVRYIEAFNKQSQGLKLAETITKDFAARVSEYGQFTKEAWDLAKSQASAEVTGMRQAEKKVPIGFESRRAKEIIQQSIRRSEIESSIAFMEKASLRGEMSGFGGVLYDSTMKKLAGADEDLHPLVRTVLVVPKAAFGMFLRVAIMGANVIQKTTPILPMVTDAVIAMSLTGKKMTERARAKMDAGANVMLQYGQFINSYSNDLMSKFVGTDRMMEYAEDRQLGYGYVTKSKSEVAVDISVQAMATVLMAGLYMAMFDEDDEGNVVLDPDRWIDISASLNNDPFTNEVGGMKRYSVRYRKSDGSWGEPLSFALYLPFVAAMSILGGTRDDILFRKEEFDKKTPSQKVGSGILDILGVFSEVSFNGNAQSIDKLIRAGNKARAEDSLAPWGDAFTEIGIRPVKSIMPGVYRDVIVNELGIMMGEDAAKKPKGFYENLMKDVPLLDSYIKNERYDEYGNPIYRESKAVRMVERMSFNYVDFYTANQKTRQKPEWKLSLKHEGLITPSHYFPDKNLVLKEDRDGKKKGERITDLDREAISRAVAVRKGQIVNEYYEDLNDMPKEVLEQMLEKIHNFAGNIIKFEMGYSLERPKFNFGKSEKAIEDKIEDNEN